LPALPYPLTTPPFLYTQISQRGEQFQGNPNCKHKSTTE